MATFQLSPGVVFSETDLTGIIPAVSSSSGAFGGVFSWGPIGEWSLIDVEATLVSRYGTPTNNNYETFLTASSFLAYTNALYVSRAANTTSTNAAIGAWNAIANVGAVSNVVAQTTKNNTDYSNRVGTYDPNLMYLAKYPGIAGNSLRVSIVDSASAYSSNVVVNNAVATGTLVINAGSNVASIVVTTQGSGQISDAIALANGVSANLTIGDRLAVGNSTIGSQFVQVTGISNVNVSGNTATVTVNLLSPYRLATNWNNGTINRYWEFSSVVGTPPTQTSFVHSNGNTAAQDALHAVVVDAGGYFTGTPNSVLEVFANMSRATDATNLDGTGNYYKNIINGSKYIRWANDRAGSPSANAATVATSTNSSSLNLYFTGGNDGASESNVAISDLANAYELFVDPESVDINLVLTGKSIGGLNGEQIGNWILDNISTARKDCVAFISPPLSAVVNNYGNEVNSLISFRNLVRSTSYGFLDSGYKQMYDQYNNVYRWVPLNGDVAGLCARTDSTNDPWWAPAGYNRGQLKNVVKLAFNPNKTARDLMFPNNINPVVTFNTDGTVLYGDKTLTAKASAFDAINVRRLFIVLEKAIAKASKYFLWEFNDSYTQAQFRNMVNPYLRTIQGARGITGFLVVCDGTTNTAEIMNIDGFVANIYIQPGRAIRNIGLNFVATPQGVTFSEVELPSTSA